MGLGLGEGRDDENFTYFDMLHVCNPSSQFKMLLIYKLYIMKINQINYIKIAKVYSNNWWLKSASSNFYNKMYTGIFVRPLSKDEPKLIKEAFKEARKVCI